VSSSVPGKPRARKLRRWIQVGFLLWAAFSLSWLANSVRTQGVDDALLLASEVVAVNEREAALEFLPTNPQARGALVFICGSGIHPHAYAPLLRPIAEAGYPVFVVRLPYRFAPLESHKAQAVDRVRSLVAAQPETVHWVIAGHSLGGALAARLARETAELNAAFVLIGTTHPKADDLSGLDAPFTKVYATHDGIAPPDRVMATRGLLPARSRWVTIQGGNHSQFGHYGRQLFDGKAAISREAQQAITRELLLEALRPAATATPASPDPAPPASAETSAPRTGPA